MKKKKLDQLRRITYIDVSRDSDQFASVKSLLTVKGLPDIRRSSRKARHHTFDPFIPAGRSIKLTMFAFGCATGCSKSNRNGCDQMKFHQRGDPRHVQTNRRHHSPYIVDIVVLIKLGRCGIADNSHIRMKCCICLCYITHLAIGTGHIEYR